MSEMLNITNGGIYVMGKVVSVVAVITGILALGNITRKRKSKTYIRVASGYVC